MQDVSVSEVKIAKAVNDSMDTLQKIYALPRDQRTESDIAMAKVAVATWQTYVNQVKQNREDKRFTVSLIQRMTQNQAELAEYIRVAMPELKIAKALPEGRKD